MTLNLDSKADMKGEVIKGLRMSITGFTIEELLQHWITNSVFYVDNDGYLRKSVMYITTWT